MSDMYEPEVLTGDGDGDRSDVALLRDLVEIASVSGDEERAIDRLLEHGDRLGFTTARDEAGNGVLRAGPENADQSIYLLGHIDTVPGWIPVREEDGILHGRGSVDAKGPLATFVAASSRVAQTLHRTQLTVIAAVREESDGGGGRHVAQALPAPTYAIIGEPSHWNGLTIGYKGSMSIEYERTQAMSHTAGEEPMVAEYAVDFWNRLRAYTDEYNREITGLFDRIDPALRNVQTCHDGLYATVSMRINLRLPPTIEAEAFGRLLATWAGDARLEIFNIDSAYRASRSNALVRSFSRAIRARDAKPHIKLKTGTSDMNAVGPAWKCPILAYGPGDSRLDHTPVERIDLSEYARAIDVLAEVLSDLDRHPADVGGA